MPTNQELLDSLLAKANGADTDTYAPEFEAWAEALSAAQDASGAALQVADTIADLKALTASASAARPTCIVRGYYSAGDGGGGLFRWNGSSTATDNGGTVIALTVGGTGRWERVHDGRMNIREFGAKGDATTDDTAAIQAAVAALITRGGGTLYGPKGVYRLTGTITITRGIRVVGDGAGTDGTTFRHAVAAGDGFVVNTTEPCEFVGISIDAYGLSVGTTKAAGTSAIYFTGDNRRSCVKRCRLIGFDYLVRTNWAGENVVSESVLLDYLSVGVYWEQDGGTDYGHNTVSNCVIWDLNVGTSQACIRYDKGGDVRVIGNKLLGGEYGIYVALDAGPTGTMLVMGNSVEQQQTRFIEISQATSGADWANLVIVGNQFSMIGLAVAAAGGIRINAGTSGGAYRWVRNITISHNIFNQANAGSEALINILDGEAINVQGNVIDLNNVAGHTGIAVAAAAVDVEVLDNIVNRTSTPYGTIASTTRFRDVNTLRTDTSGRLGLGTTPDTMLHVLAAGDVAHFRDSTNGSDLYIGGSGLLNIMLIRTGGADALSFGTNASTTRHVTINTDGSVAHRSEATTIIDASSHLGLRSYTVATLPSAATAARIIYVSDGTTNKRLAVSDGTNWRFPDGNIVS